MRAYGKIKALKGAKFGKEFSKNHIFTPGFQGGATICCAAVARGHFCLKIRL